MSCIDIGKMAPGLLIIMNFLRTQLLNYVSFHTFAAMWSSENFERSIFIHIFQRHVVARNELYRY